MKGLRPDGHAGKALNIGDERIRKSGSQGKPIWFVKVSNELCGGEHRHRAPYQWKKKHILVWENEHGPIPKGYKVTFLNQDTLDCKSSNLYLISDAANMMMTKYNWFSTNPTLTKTAIMCCELELLLKGGT